MTTSINILIELLVLLLHNPIMTIVAYVDFSKMLGMSVFRKIQSKMQPLLEYRHDGLIIRQYETLSFLLMVLFYCTEFEYTSIFEKMYFSVFKDQCPYLVHVLVDRLPFSYIYPLTWMMTAVIIMYLLSNGLKYSNYFTKMSLVVWLVYSINITGNSWSYYQDHTYFAFIIWGICLVLPKYTAGSRYRAYLLIFLKYWFVIVIALVCCFKFNRYWLSAQPIGMYLNRASVYYTSHMELEFHQFLIVIFYRVFGYGNVYYLKYLCGLYFLPYVFAVGSIVGDMLSLVLIFLPKRMVKERSYLFYGICVWTYLEKIMVTPSMMPYMKLAMLSMHSPIMEGYVNNNNAPPSADDSKYNKRHESMSYTDMFTIAVILCFVVSQVVIPTRFMWYGGMTNEESLWHNDYMPLSWRKDMRVDIVGGHMELQMPLVTGNRTFIYHPWTYGLPEDVQQILSHNNITNPLNKTSNMKVPISRYQFEAAITDSARAKDVVSFLCHYLSYKLKTDVLVQPVVMVSTNNRPFSIKYTPIRWNPPEKDPYKLYPDFINSFKQSELLRTNSYKMSEPFPYAYQNILNIVLAPFFAIDDYEYDINPYFNHVNGTMNVSSGRYNMYSINKCLPWYMNPSSIFYLPKIEDGIDTVHISQDMQDCAYFLMMMEHHKQQKLT